MFASRRLVFHATQFVTAVCSDCPPRFQCHKSVGVAVIFITMCVALACLKSVSRASYQRGHDQDDDCPWPVIYPSLIQFLMSTVQGFSIRFSILVSGSSGYGHIEAFGNPSSWLSFDRKVNATPGHYWHIGAYGWQGRKQRS
jgi:hypothetical protein